MSLKIMTAPGPVSYPLVVATKVIKDLELNFGKSGNDYYAVADSLVSLARRGLKPTIITVRRLMVIYPELKGPNVGVWRRGSAADVLIRAFIDERGLTGLNFIYADDWYSLVNMLKSGQVQSAVLNAALVDRGGLVFLEDALGLPGACGIHVNGDPQPVVNAYEAGLELIREDPEGSTEYIASKLPVRVPREFIANMLRRAEYGIFKPSETGINRLMNIVSKYSDAGYE